LRSHVHCLALTCAFIVSPFVCEAQVVRRAGFAPMPDAQFEIVRQFYDFDRTLPLDVRVVQKTEDDHSRIEKVVFTSTAHERVPGLLALPKRGRAPYPCVLLVHGLNDSKDYWWDHPRAADLTSRLLEAGTAVFAIDLRYHGERSAPLDYMAPMYLTFENTLYVRNRDMIIQSAIDCRRALDALRGRTDIDSTRLAAAGVSLGGMISIYLGALEPQLRTIACASTPSHVQLLPADHYSFAARAALPVLLMAGRADWHTSAEDSQTLLGLFPNPDRHLTMYEGGHSLPAAWTAEASVWLQSHLRAGGGR